MISRTSLDRAQSTLAAVRQFDLKPQEWNAVAAIVRRVQRAIHVGDEAALDDAVSELVELMRAKKPALGAGPGTRERPRGGPRGGIPTLDRPRSGDRGTPTGERAPDDLVAAIDGAAAAVDATTAQIVRIPHLDVDTKLPVKPGQSFSVAVYLDKTPSRADENAEPFELRDPPPDEDIAVDVWLTSTPHFSIAGSATDVIVLRRNEDASTRASFTVTVREPVPADAGPPALRARFDYRLRASGSVRREIPIMAGDNVLADARPEPAAPDRLVLDAKAGAPDLAISIAPLRGSTDSYKVVVKTGLLGGVTVEDDWNLSDDSATYVAETMGGFTAKNATPLARRRALEGAGMEFFTNSPKQFQDLYWRLIDAGAPPTTVLLISEERSIPWELMIPSRRTADGRYQRLAPLGVQCAIGRWHGDDYVCPGQVVPLQDSLILAPTYNPPLPQASAERDLILELFPGQSVPATFDELDAFYGAHTASLFHFVCHGRDATLQAIKLLQNQVLWANQVRAGGLGMACRKSRPLIFLNACEVGRPGAGLAAVGGFAASFIACDAGAVIAPLWAVDDGVAHQVAVTFYGTVKKKPETPFADILRELRAKAYAAEGEDSYAAYCFYGDPHASAVRP
jgi:CHAT domain